MSVFAYFNPHVVSCFFSVSLIVRVVQPCHRRGLFEVLVTYLGSLCYFPTWGPGVAKWSILRKAIANGGVQCVQHAYPGHVP
jgi:hypothetical protein